MTTSRVWLDRHEADIPDPMRDPIRAALETTGGDDAGAGLLDASLLCLRHALEIGDDRSAAVHLLAADALLTAAFDAAVSEGPTLVRSLAERAAADLARLLPDPAP